MSCLEVQMEKKSVGSDFCYFRIVRTWNISDKKSPRCRMSLIWKGSESSSILVTSIMIEDDKGKYFQQCIFPNSIFKRIFWKCIFGTLLCRPIIIIITIIITIIIIIITIIIIIKIIIIIITIIITAIIIIIRIRIWPQFTFCRGADCANGCREETVICFAGERDLTTLVQLL